MIPRGRCVAAIRETQLLIRGNKTHGAPSDRGTAVGAVRTREKHLAVSDGPVSMVQQKPSRLVLRMPKPLISNRTAALYLDKRVVRKVVETGITGGALIRGMYGFSNASNNLPPRDITPSKQTPSVTHKRRPALDSNFEGVIVAVTRV